jgi:hypothetical protein
MNAINTTDIPRYAASMPIQTQFITNADGNGDHVFSLVKRHGNVCIYKRTNISDGRPSGFEVFESKVVKAGTSFGGGSVIQNDYESYPGKSSFGKSAWFCMSLDRAEQRFNQLTAPKAPQYVIPQGEFTWVDFAKANNLPLISPTFQILFGMIATKKVKESRRVQLADGKSAGFYTAV